MNSESAAATSPSAAPAPAKKVVRKAIGPRLRIVFNVMLVLLALIAANSAYLLGVKLLEWWTSRDYQDYFYTWMFLLHIVVGVLIVAPFLAFGIVHMRNTKDRKIRRTVNIGYALFGVCIVILLSGFALVRIEGVLDLKHPTARSAVYWAHVACPVIGLWLYWLHRLVGPKMRLKQGFAFAGLAGLTAVGMVFLQAQDPRDWNSIGPKEGTQYFEPSLTRTSSGNFIPASTLDMNQYCLKCHQDSHKEWSDSVHRFSSFNNPTYLASVAETREVALQRDGDVKASRWCAGCHDPVPFLSGAFDDPEFDMLNHPTAKSGITCTVCHAITHVNSNVGNADFTIEEPQHYPFAKSENEVLQWINNQLIKAKPSFHKKTFLKPLHKTAEFCSACHKVHLPYALNHYRDWLRGQNHYDSWLLSGVSGHGIRSFYYPPKAQNNCNECHMPVHESDDFGARLVDDSGKLKIHDHLFPSANTGVAWLRDREEIIKEHQEFLDGVMRVDLFGVREGGTIDGELTAPLRPEVPVLEPGKSYLLETVIRTLKMGHHFTQGTTDSNEVWLEVTAVSDGEMIGDSGLMKKQNEVDPWAHFVNNFMLDRYGNRIDRRNAQDIFVPLYMHQIPPGAGQTVHYRLPIPDHVSAPVTVKVRLLYRKFDTQYMQYVDEKLTKLGADPIRGRREGDRYVNDLPITVLAEDEVTFPINAEDRPENDPVDFPEWQRWNDYGIGMLLKGKAELKQAAEAFAEVEKLGRYDGPLNLVRVWLQEAGEGQIPKAVAALERATAFDDPAPPPWTVAWLSGELNVQNRNLQQAEDNFRQALNYRTAETIERGFDFTRDYVVNNKLGEVIFDLAMNERGNQERRDQRLQEAVEVFEQTLLVDSENVTAHHNLAQLHAILGNAEQAQIHRDLHGKFKPDDTARGQAVGAAREKYPAANQAAEPLVIYELDRRASSESTSNASAQTDLAEEESPQQATGSRDNE